MSDIHFEPFWDPGKAAKLAAAPVAEWKTILASPDSADREERFAELQADVSRAGRGYVSMRCMSRACERCAQNAADAKFVIVSGDLMAHSFSCKFAALFQNAAPGDYRAFAEKTVEFVVGSLREAFPGVPVYAALGNNDSDCGDYQLDADSEFLAAIAAKCYARDCAGRSGSRRHGRLRRADITARACRRRWSTRDCWCWTICLCRGGMRHAAARTIRRLRRRRLRGWSSNWTRRGRSNEKVWVMAHIPPGVDPYSTATKGKNICKGNEPTMFLSSEALPEAMARLWRCDPAGDFCAHAHG